MPYATTNPQTTISNNSLFEKRLPHGLFLDPILSAAWAEMPRAAKYIMIIATTLSQANVDGESKEPMTEKEIHIPV